MKFLQTKPDRDSKIDRAYESCIRPYQTVCFRCRAVERKFGVALEVTFPTSLANLVTFPNLSGSMAGASTSHFQTFV